MSFNYRINSNAKINIGLRILSKRKDGYHNIETIFYPVKLYDKIYIKIAPSKLKENKIKINFTPQQSIQIQDNICYKALHLFLRKYRIHKKYIFDIRIKKKIPVGGGLGGGSSNAASVLKILAKHFKIPTFSKKFSKTALELGSDVPFFLINKPAYASSRGEKLAYLPNFKIPHHILIVYPKILISTKWAYDSLNRSKKKYSPKFRDIQSFDIKTAKEIFVNDFEETVFKKYLEIRNIKEKMYSSGAVFALMSGSGSSVYGFFENKKALLTAKKYFKEKNYFAVMC